MKKKVTLTAWNLIWLPLFVVGSLSIISATQKNSPPSLPKPKPLLVPVVITPAVPSMTYITAQFQSTTNNATWLAKTNFTVCFTNDLTVPMELWRVQLFITNKPIVFPTVAVTTYHNDNYRTGQNTNETILTPSNVNSNQFGRLFSYSVDGFVYGQPLYVSGLVVNGQSHNALIVATENDSVYAFDADNNNNNNNTGLLWFSPLGDPALLPNTNDPPYNETSEDFMGPSIGITSTPVIDLTNGILYVTTFVHEGTNYDYFLHALNITNGYPKFLNSPVRINGWATNFNHSSVAFKPQQQIQRSALTLANGTVYVCFCGYADAVPYYGWIFGYNATNLQQVSVFNDNPMNIAAGIWMSGDGLAFDNTNLYLLVGNGGLHPGAWADYGNCFLKLSPSLTVLDFFAPSNEVTLSSQDSDVGSGGILLLPDNTSLHPHLMVGCGKEGIVYLVDRDNLGGYDTNANHIVEQFYGCPGGVWETPAYFNGMIYYQAWDNNLKAFQITNGFINPTPISHSLTIANFPSPGLSVSANGTNNAILWALQTDVDQYGDSASPTHGLLHAYNAYDLSQELYNSNMNGTNDWTVPPVKFVVPTVANGKVYVVGQYGVTVYGNR